MSNPRLILIAGPTASGKSALALDLARKTRGTIINADAMQIYAGLPVLTAQPGAREQKEIPHALYGVLDPSEHSSAGRWLELVKEAIGKAVTAGRTPILAGGTGLYFKALLGGLAYIPPVPQNVRTKAERLYDQLGEEKFRHELTKFDSRSAARLAKNDRQRLIRAYEVAVYTEKPIGEWHKKAVSSSLENYIIEPCLLMPPREELYAACDLRFDQMIEQGAVEEVKRLLERKLAPDLPAMKILGVREIISYLEGKTTLEQAIAKAQQATRNYAKRQMTWFRNQWQFN